MQVLAWLAVAWFGLVGGVVARQELDLGGTWSMCAAEKYTEAPPADAEWKDQLVPMLFPRAGDKTCYWFKRTVEVPAEWAGKRVHLLMEGAAAWSTVFVNGKKLADDFTLNYLLDVDATEAIKPGAANEILIAVQNYPDLYWQNMEVDGKPYRVSRFPGAGNDWQGSIGIWQPIRLRATEPVFVEMVFVRPSYRQMRLDVDVWVKNEGAKDAEVEVAGDVKDGVKLPAVKAKVPAGATVKTTLGAPWKNPKLWSIGEPNLYWLTTTVLQGRKALDKRKDRFGFREFWVDGDHYKMNGARLYLNLATAGMYTPVYHNRTIEQAQEAFLSEFLKPYVQANGNMMRWWFQVPKYLKDVCDEQGVLINDMFLDDQGIGVSVGPVSVYWKNCEKLFDRYFATRCNSPSVFYWTIQNEGWINPKPGDWGKWLLEQMQTLARYIMEKDPTRFVNSDGDGDLGGWASNVAEYSGGVEIKKGILPQISWHHKPGNPDNPRSYYWVEEKQMPTWDRSKPVVLGEFDMNVAQQIEFLSHFGERLFHGKPVQAVEWVLDEHLNPTVRAVELPVGDVRFTDQSLACDPWIAYGALIRAARVQGVSGTHPWGVVRWADGAKAQSPELVVPREFDLAFHGGQKVARRIYIINGLFRRNASPLVWSLKGRGVDLGGKVALDLPAGEHKEVVVEWDLPVVKERTDCLFSVQYGAFSESFLIRLWPAFEPLRAEGKKVAVYDPEGLSLEAVKRAAPEAKELTDLEELKGENKPDLLVLGDESVGEDFGGTQIVKDYVARGGRAVILQQTELPPTGMLPLGLSLDSQRKLQSRVFVAAPNHPLLAGLDDFDFKDWAGDYYVSRIAYAKPTVGNFRILLQTTHWRGLNNTPLVELPSGAGVFVLSQLDLSSKASKAPMAEEMLKRLVKYGLEYEPQKAKRGVIISSKESAATVMLRDRLGLILDLVGDVTTEALTEADVVVMDGTDAGAIERVKAGAGVLKAAVEGGKTLLWHRLTPEQAEVAGAILGKPVEVKANAANVHNFAKAQPYPALLDGLSSYDTWYATVGIFPVRPKNVKVAEHFVSVEGGEELLRSGGLVRVPVGQGQALLSQVLWDAYTLEEKDLDLQDRQERYITVLLNNLGIPSQARGGVVDAFDIPNEKTFQVNLRPFVNMAFKDDEPANGKGGWSDQGLNDMRYFPVGPRRFQGVLFDVIDPDQNENRSCLNLGKMTPELKARVEGEGIPVKEKAKRLFVMNGSAWTPHDGRILAEYTVHYVDGTKETFPIRGGVELNDWWVPSKPPNGYLAWVGKLAYAGWGAEVAMFMMEWPNPHPEKEIDRITIHNRHHNYILVAITGEKP